MQLKLTGWWGKQKPVAVYEAVCALRPCLHVDYDKGSFTPGVGYTSYYKNPPLVCLTRLLHGCPHPLPEPDAEKARCCPAPTFAKSRGARRQKCKTCGTRSEGLALKLVKTLPHYPASRCSHEDVEETTWCCEVAWRCRRCRQWWDEQPKPHAAGEELKAFSARRMREWQAKRTTS